MARPIEATRTEGKQSAVLSIKITWELYDLLRLKAKENNLTVSKLVRNIIKQNLI
ncbi:MAG: hypothetical protein PHO42_01420 [Candidatus Omnitrophica bacterium]|nr:hypothetical protein [Candidatus Omnitrophota bacterium]